MKYSYLYIISFITVLFVSCAAPPPIEITDTSKEIELECFTVILPPENKWTAKNLSGFRLPDPHVCFNLFAFTSNQEELYFSIIFNNPHGWRVEYTEESFLNKIKEIETDIDAEIEIVSGVKDICIKRKIKKISSVPPPPDKIMEGLKLKHTVRYKVEETLAGINLKPSDNYYITFLTYYVAEVLSKNWYGDAVLSYTIYFTYISTDERPEEELETKALNFLKNVKFQKD